jgi:hypothetical protein
MVPNLALEQVVLNLGLEHTALESHAPALVLPLSEGAHS